VAGGADGVRSGCDPLDVEHHAVVIEIPEEVLLGNVVARRLPERI
jgi:hypothetical protein